MAEKRTIELEVESNLNESTENVKSLKAQLKELKTQLLSLDEGSEEFKKIAQEAGALQDKIGDVNRQVKNFASDTRKLDVAMEGVTAVSGAFQGVEGAMALVGVESEDLQKTMVKLQAVMAVTNSLQTVANALNKDSALTQALNATATKIMTVAQVGYTAAVGTSTGALKAFRIALISTGIGAIVVAVGLLIANFDKVVLVVKNVINWFSGLSGSMKNVISVIFPVIGVIRLLVAGLEELGVVETKQENRQRLMDEAAKKRADNRLLELNRQKNLREKLSKVMEDAYNKQDKAMSREIALLKAQGKDTTELERARLKATIRYQTNLQQETYDLWQQNKQKNELIKTELYAIGVRENDFKQYNKFVAESSAIQKEIVAENQRAKEARLNAINDLAIFEAEVLKRNSENQINSNKSNTKEILDLTRQRIDKEISLTMDGYEKEKKILEEKAKREKEDLAESIKGKVYDANEYAKTQKLIDDNLKKDLRQLNSKYFDGELKARNLSIESLKNSKIKELEIEIAANKEKAELQKQFDQQEKERIQQLNRDKYKLAKDGFQLVSDLASLFGQQDEKKARLAFQVDKAAKISSATIAGYEAVLEAYKTGQKSPLTAVFPAYPYVQAGLAGAFAAVNIAKIGKAKFQSSGGGNMSSSGGGGAATMTANFSTIGSSGINQLAQLQQQPTQAYVVSGEVTSAQALDRNRVQNATL